MPELPEVETVRRGLVPVLEGHRLARVIQRREDLRFPIPDGFGQRLTGRIATRVGRRGKFLLVTFDDGTVLIWHLGMSGRVCVYPADPPPEVPHDHVIFETEEGVVIRFNDARRFGFVDLTDRDRMAAHPMLAGLGPDPVLDPFSAAVLAPRLANKRTPIKSAIMDQRVIAGIGNIYACESLFRAGLSPRRSAHTVQGGRAGRLAGAITAVLAAAIEAGGSSLRDHRRTSGELGYFQHRFAVYDRAGKPCPGCDCGGVVRQIVQSGRSTFYCPRRQR